MGSPQSSLRTLPCPQAGPGILSSPNIWPCPSYQVGSLSETWMSGNEDHPRVLIPHRDLPGLKVRAVTCGVPSDWGPGSPESSVSVFPLTSWRVCTLPSAHMRLHPLSQVPSLSEAQMSGSKERPSVLFSPQGLPGWTTGAGISEFHRSSLGVSPPSGHYLVPRQDSGFSHLPISGPVPLTR